MDKAWLFGDGTLAYWLLGDWVLIGNSLKKDEEKDHQRQLPGTAEDDWRVTPACLTPDWKPGPVDTRLSVCGTYPASVPSAGFDSEHRKSKGWCASFVRGDVCKTGANAEGAEVGGIL